MSFHTSQLTYAFGLGGMMSFYGIVGVIVYMLPPSSVGNTEKIVIVALVLLTLPFALIAMFVVSRRAKKKEKREAAEAEAAAAGQASETATAENQPQNLAAPTGNYDLNGGTEEAVQFLKSSNLGGKDAVYALPWYIVAGAPKSGKSSLVMGSNLNFQTLPSQRQSEQKFIRPTGNVDWRVTSDAVFVDTAGRYQTEGVDADEWASMLETIKKHRGNRPVDGFILTVNAEQVLKSDERKLEELAKVLRARLDETMQRLKVRFPVYVVFTHADTIEGFRDSFSSSKNEDKSFVWGATIPIEKSENAQALFDGEYEILHNSLMKRRLARLSAPFPPVRQLRIFNFPLHFGSARRKFGSFMNSLFRPNPFSENPFLRGFYFTASPVARSAGNAPPQVGNPYFTERFFRDVVLRDKDLVKTFVAQRQKAPIFGWFVTLLALFITLVLLVMSGVSLISNRQMLADAEDRGLKVLTIVKADAGKNPLDKKDTEARAEINATENLRELIAKLDDYERNGAPIYMRFGLYSGNQLYRKNLLPMYMAVVEQRFKAPTVKKIEADLKKFAASNPVANSAQPTEEEEKVLGKHYDLLKAYLMLSGDYKEKAEASHIAAALKDYWSAESKIPADMKLTAQQQLEFWSKQVDRDDADVRFPRISLDGKLVQDTRTKLQAFPAPYRYLSRKVTEISKEVDDKVGTTTTESILTRNGADTSFLSGSYSVPSAYTRPGYELMKVAIAEADEKLSEDDWVMGELGKKQIAQTTDASKIEDRYFRDYSDHWRNFVKAVHVKPYKNKTEATNALQAFSSANSPMKILAREIARNTNLSAKPEVEGWWPWIKSFFTSGQDTETGGTQPEKEFRPLFTFIGTKAQAENAPVERYQNEIGKMFKDFNGLSEDKIKSIALEMQKDEDPIKLRARETAVTNLLQGFSESSSSQELATLLQEPLGNLKTLLGAGAKDQIAKAWVDQILPAAKEIEKGYPFEDSSSEADLTKLSAFLAPGEGKLSKFYDDKLSKYFEEAGGQLKMKENTEVQFTEEFIAYLNNAFALRKALFGTNPTPKFEYEFTLRPVKDAMIEVSIDGQKTTSTGTGSLKGTFPGGSSAETGVLMELASTSGTTSTSAASPSANSPGSSVNTSSPAQSDPGTGSSGQPLKYQGTWGLFRFVDAGGAAKQPGGEYLLNYKVGGKSVTASIKASGGDLFDKNIFRQVKAPQNFLK
ncbi:MAG: type VI secretion system membrane subunit TssM [Saprospiraceae bacterium]|nr:type VI secretion system membrane subunit TssM [Pyrinomonadaceae bacterium]